MWSDVLSISEVFTECKNLGECRRCEPEYAVVVELFLYLEYPVTECIRIFCRLSKNICGALLAATMKESGISKIYTKNTRDFDKVPWLEVINPFE